MSDPKRYSEKWTDWRYAEGWTDWRDWFKAELFIVICFIVFLLVSKL